MVPFPTHLLRRLCSTALGLIFLSIMVPFPTHLLRRLCSTALGLIFLTSGYAVLAFDLHAIGRIESLYRDRASMRILKLVATPTPKIALTEGHWVSFDIPQVTSQNRRRRSIRYGDVVEVRLLGHSATEYATSETDGDTSPIKPGALIWSTKSIERVKNPRKYDQGTHDDGTRRGQRNKEKDPPPKIWTQEETVRGQVLVRDGNLYLKEDRLGRRDKGLHVITPAWVEKLKPYDGQRVVVHGITHRVTVSSGTMEIENLLRIHPK